MTTSSEIAYLDASVLVALLTTDPCTHRAETFFDRHTPTPIVSDFAAAEFVSAISRRVRTGELRQIKATSALADRDRWIEEVASRRDCQEFRVGAAMMNPMEVPDGTTQSSPHP